MSDKNIEQLKTGVYSKLLWYGLPLLALLVLRIPSFYTGFIDNDENIYMAIGYGMSHGLPLYTGVWDHKPPLFYFLYWGIYTLFGANYYAIKLILLGLSGVWVFLLSHLVKKVIPNVWGVVSLLVAVFCIAYPFESFLFNSEQFFAPCVALAVFYGWFWYKKTSQKNWNWYPLAVSVIFASLASFTKFQAMLEVFGLLGVFLLILVFEKKISLRRIPLVLGLYLIGIFVPYCVYLLTRLPDASEILYTWVIFNSGYATQYNPQNTRVLEFILYASGAFSALVFLYFRHKISTIQFFASSWLIGVFFLASSPGRPYLHYLIPVITPAFLFLLHVSQICLKRAALIKLLVSVVIIFICIQFFSVFMPAGVGRFWQDQTANWNRYRHGYFVVSNPLYLSEWRAWWTAEGTDIGRIATYVRNSTPQNTKLVATGFYPQFYFLSDRLNAHRFLTEYHTPWSETERVFAESQKEKPLVYIVYKPGWKYSFITHLLKRSDFNKSFESGNFEVWRSP